MLSRARTRVGVCAGHTTRFEGRRWWHCCSQMFRAFRGDGLCSASFIQSRKRLLQNRRSFMECALQRIKQSCRGCAAAVSHRCGAHCSPVRPVPVPRICHENTRAEQQASKRKRVEFFWPFQSQAVCRRSPRNAVWILPLPEPGRHTPRHHCFQPVGQTRRTLQPSSDTGSFNVRGNILPRFHRSSRW